MATTHDYDFPTDQSLNGIEAAIRSLATGYVSTPARDATTGLYDNDELARWMAQGRTGKVYGYREPKDKTVALTKLGDNAGLAVPTPWTLAAEGSDPYPAEGGPFRHWDVNASISDSCVEQVYAFSWDQGFSLTAPANGEVMVARPTFWYREYEDDSYVYHWWCDSPRDGFVLCPGAVRPDGSVRPFILTAKYPLSDGSDGLVHSVSGAETKRFVSHDSAVSFAAKRGAGWSLLSAADLWYVQHVLCMKYGTKNSQSVFAGCTSYSTQCQPTVAETGTNRVIVSNASANALVVGSAMMLGAAGGTATSAPDRGMATSYDKLSSGRITAIETYDDDNKAVIFGELGKTFDTATTDWLSTTEWRCGACDGLGGDGSPTSPTSGKEPFLLQGIELGHGGYEVVEDLAISYDADGAHLMLDPSPVAGKVSDSAMEVGLMPQGDADAWKYPLYVVTRNGSSLSQGDGGSQSQGNCDGQYVLKSGTVGTREFLAFGNLGNWGSAGLRYVYANFGLGYGRWVCASRLSGGRRGGESAA